MDKFVSQQSGHVSARRRLQQSPFSHSIIARLVMLQAETSDIIAQREQEMITAIVMGAKQRKSFGHQALVLLNQVRGKIYPGSAVANNINLMRRFFGTKIHFLEE